MIKRSATKNHHKEVNAKHHHHHHYEEEVMSVDEQSIVNEDRHQLNNSSRYEDEKHMHVKTRDLKQKDNYLFFELFGLYTKQQVLQ